MTVGPHSSTSSRHLEKKKRKKNTMKQFRKSPIKHLGQFKSQPQTFSCNEGFGGCELVFWYRS